MLPNDPSDPNNRNNNPPPPFGTHFDPHSNPIDPNNPYASPPPQNPVPEPPQIPISSPNIPNTPNIPESSHPSVHSEVAQHRPRDAHGHFLPYEHPQTPVQPEMTPQTPSLREASPTTQTPPNPSAPSNPPSPLPPLIETNPKQDSKDEDPPLIKVTNPVTYFKRWWNKLMSKEGIDFKMGFRIKPVTAVLITSIIITGGVSSGITALVLKTFFPTSSPVLHRQIVQQGIIQKTSSGGFYLSSSDQSMWKLKPKKPNINLADQVGKQVTVTGNLTKEKNLIEVSEIILSETGPSQFQNLPSQTSPNPPNNPNLPNIPNQDLLPKLYSGLQWDLTQRKILIFTSGKRKIEQEGVYLESAQVNNLPQEFINYYTQELTNSGFRETLNSSDPNGTTITFAKDDLFLTFGVKNVFSGSGDNKKIAGYKAYIEHN